MYLLFLSTVLFKEIRLVQLYVPSKQLNLIRTNGNIYNIYVYVLYYIIIIYFIFIMYIYYIINILRIKHKLLDTYKV